MLVSSSFKLTIASALLVTLVACKSTQERADGYFESGVTLIESGDPDRAIVEFRNAFELHFRRLLVGKILKKRFSEI